MNQYDGTSHPEEWVKQVRLTFYDKNKNVGSEQEIVDFCKLHIPSYIKIPPETDSFVALINALKSDVSYESFKGSVKRRLIALKVSFVNESDILTFLNTFQRHCYEGEINEIGEQKQMFLNLLPRDSIQHSFVRLNFDKINSMKELLEYFDQSLLEEPRIIKKNSFITLKHVATGNYLTSSLRLSYSDSRNNVVFAAPVTSEYLNNSVWEVSKYDSQDGNALCYGNLFQLIQNSELRYIMEISDSIKSPATKHSQVSIGRPKSLSLYHCKGVNSINSPYVYDKDIVYLQDNNGFTLRSHEFTFTIRDKNLQEVVGHKERLGGNDE
ncbi:11834_t:CDS:2, partial [Funneliformis geosporum]